MGGSGGDPEERSAGGRGNGGDMTGQIGGGGGGNRNSHTLTEKDVELSFHKVEKHNGTFTL